MALAGSAVATLISGVAAGLAYGMTVGDVGGKLPTVVGTAAVQLPAVWLLSAVTVGLFGLAPRFTPVAWGVLVGFIALYLLGSLAGFRRCCSTWSRSPTSRGSAAAISPRCRCCGCWP